MRRVDVLLIPLPFPLLAGASLGMLLNAVWGQATNTSYVFAASLALVALFILVSTLTRVFSPAIAWLGGIVWMCFLLDPKILPQKYGTQGLILLACLLMTGIWEMCAWSSRIRPARCVAPQSAEPML